MKQIKKLQRKMLPGLLAVLLVVQIFLPAQIFLDPPRIEIQEVKAANWYDTDWDYRVKLTIQASQVDADLTDFPIYIDLGNLHAGFHTNVNQTDARDIRVTKADGTTELPREVVVYDSTTDTGELHTKYSGVLSSTVDTDIYIYYGNGSATDYAVDATYGRNNVWESAAKMVQHLSENPAGGEPPDGSDEIFDSTSNANDGNTGGTMTIDDQVTGQIDGSVDFDGTDDYVSVADDPSLQFASNFTVSAWIKPNLDSSYSGIIGKVDKFSTGDKEGWVFRINDNNCLEFFTRDTDNPITHDYDISSYDDTWIFVSGVYDGTNNLLYINGNQVDSVTNSYAPSSNELLVGAYVWGTVVDNDGGPYYFNGSIDGVKIYNRALSVDEISTQYNNQSSPSTFYTLGIEEKQAPTALTNWSYRKEIVINHSEVDTNLTNFPVLINLGSDTDLAGDALSSGNDILFTTDSIAWSTGDENDKLAHEIEKFTSATGELQAWVRVPSLSSSADTTIYMYYGYDSATNQQNPATVWDGNTKMVQHLNEDPVHVGGEEYGTTDAIVDSTSNVNHGTSHGTMTSDDQVSGQIDGSVDFDGTDDYVDCGSDSSLDITDAITIEVWVKRDTLSGSPRIVDKTRDTAYAFRMATDGTIEFAGKFGGTTQTPGFSTSGFSQDQWGHVVATYDGSIIRYYINGNAAGTRTPSPAGSIGTNSDSLGIGAQIIGPNYYFNGSIDGVKIYNRALSANEISTQYNRPTAH